MEGHEFLSEEQFQFKIGERRHRFGKWKTHTKFLIPLLTSKSIYIYSSFPVWLYF